MVVVQCVDYSFGALVVAVQLEGLQGGVLVQQLGVKFYEPLDSASAVEHQDVLLREQQGAHELALAFDPNIIAGQFLASFGGPNPQAALPTQIQLSNAETTLPSSSQAEASTCLAAAASFGSTVIALSMRSCLISRQSLIS